MNRKKSALLAMAIATLSWSIPGALAQHVHTPAPAGTGSPESSHDHNGHAADGDSRQLVGFPAAMREHTLTSMRDHLLALAEIQAALAARAYDKAAEVAEQRLGMSSLQAHGAHESSRYMPQGMQDIGSSMHRRASRFAIEAKNAAVTGEVEPALAALARTTEACVACHAGYRLQ
ncbi:MAG: hypothetical protein Q7J47_05160 [Azoarcus sp.]|nr:hypothetical protein [Azoarcus sp.]